MKKHLVRSLLCVVSLCMSPFVSGVRAASCAETLLTPSGTTTLLGCGYGESSGIIRAADTGLPLPNVLVTQAGYSYRTTYTDVNGRYAFQYQTANGPTSVSTEVAQTGRYVGAITNLFSVVSGTVSTMNFTLTVGAVITGIVHATDVVSPLQNVSVELLSTTAPAYTPGSVQFASTDVNGYYQFQGIAPGGYKLYFDPTLGNTFVITLNKYMPTWYGGAGDAASGAVISVTTPTTITANMLLSPGATIEGDVLAADTGAGLTTYSASAYSVDKPDVRATAVRYYGTSSYAIQGLRPGAYRLAVTPGGTGTDSQDYIGQYYNNQVSSTLGDLITITQVTQTIGITVSLQRGGVITGMVRDANTLQPVTGGVVAVDNGVIVNRFNRQTSTDATGVYTITGLPTDHYHASITFYPGGPMYNSQVYNGHDEISSTVVGNWVNVTAPLTVTNVNFGLHRYFTGTVTGRVTDLLGQGIMYASVQLNRTDSTSGYGRVYAYTDVSGYYTTTTQATDYFVEFTRNTTSMCGGCYNDQFYGQSSLSAHTAVHVAPGSVVSNISAAFACGIAPPRYSVYVPLVAR